MVEFLSRRKDDKETFNENDRRKDEFLAMLAHELRNPLAPISAAASLLRLGLHDEARIKQVSEIISRQVCHMSSLIDDLLDVSRVTRGLIELDQLPVEAMHIVSDAVEQVRPLLECRRHHLTLNLSPESAVVSGDQKRLIQVITNLLNNAVKYTPAGGNIALKLEVLADRVLLSVTDDGVGMAPSLLSHAFELFVQEARTPDRSQGGLGLGLALVKSIVELHGGSVIAESAGLGLGSTFTVCLPRLAAPVVTQFDGYRPSQQTVAAPLRILVADDNTDAGNTLALLLSALGHRVVVETDGLSALARATEKPFDVGLFDIGLPDMTGNELARRIRAHASTATMTLFAVTGYGQKQDEIDSAAAGFDHHLVKPVNTERLLTLLASLCPVNAVQTM